MSIPLPPKEQDLSKKEMGVKELVKADEQRGAVVHTFDPDATTAQKKAEAGKDRGSLSPLPGVKDDSASGGAKELSIDTSRANTPAPTVTISDIDATSMLEGQGKNGAKVVVVDSEGKTIGAKGVPGAIPSSANAGLPDWYKTGWRAVSGIDGVGDDSTAAERSILAAYISEQAYGTWYHNAGVIFFAVCASHIFATFRMGWGWTIMVLAVCATYYDLSITRVRRASRDDIQRELVKTRLATESESADWINSFLLRFWKIYEPVLSATIVASVDQVLSTSTPGFLESIKMTTFTLGSKAPRIDSVRTFPKTPDDVVLMDWKISFTPTDLSDVTPRDQKFQTNPKIVLEIKIGKGFISAPMPILLEDISFVGNMRIKLKLIPSFPHVQLVEMSFLEKPIFDYVLKPIGGETLGFDIANVPGLSSFVRDQVHANLGPMMYDPNVFTLNLEQLLSGAPLDAAIGVLQLTLSSARGIKGTKIGGGTPDPYVSISLAGKAEVAKTKYKTSTFNPQWNEVKFILINSLSDVLALSVYDYNANRKDSELGVANFDLEKLKEDAEQEGLSVNILREGKERGELRFDAKFFPVLKPEKLPDGTLEEVPDTRTGICRLTIHQAKELDGSRTLSTSAVNPYAKLFIGGSKEEAHRTGVFKSNFAPSWESPFEFLVADKNSSVITVQIVDDRDFLKDPVLGKISVSLKDLLTAKEREQDWFPLSGAKTGRLRLSAEWKPLAMAGSLNGSAAYVPPIGILRIWLKKATDVKNLEATLGGKSDPYVRVLNGGNTMARTEVQNNNLNPEWDEIVYVPVHSLREHPVLEIVDYQNLTRDRPIGAVELNVSDFAAQTGDARTPYRSTGPQSRRDKIKLGKGSYKGELIYDIEFCPAVSLKGGVSFEEKENSITKSVNAAADAQPQTPTTATSLNTPIPKTNGAAPAGPSFLASPTSPSGRTSISTNGRASTDSGRHSANEEADTGIVLTKEELLATSSGILVFNIVSGHLEKKSRLEVVTGDGYWPSFGTQKSGSTHATWDTVGESFIGELDLSRITLRLNEKDESEKEDILAEISLDTRLFLEQSLSGPKEFSLLAKDGSGRKSTVKIESRFVPVDIVLLPRESANNTGSLHVQLLDGTDIKGADRSGKSDPYTVFTLNDEKVFKSETKKKTLAPVWNEKFEVDVLSRVAAHFQVELFDWNQLETAKSLGTAKIDLSDLVPFESMEKVLPLHHTKTGEKGSIRVRLVFQPAIIARSRKNTSTFSTVGRAAGQVGGIPLGVASGVGKGVFHGVVGVGQGVGSVGGFAGRKVGLVKKKDKGGNDVLAEETIEDPPSGQTSSPVDGSLVANDFAKGNGTSPLGGSLAITVLGVKDLAEEAKAHVQISIAGKTRKTGHSSKSQAPEWDESALQFSLSPNDTTASISVIEHHTLGKDKALGTAEVDIWRHISPAMPAADVAVELREGQGLLRLRLEFKAGGAGAGSSHNGSVTNLNTPISPRQASISSRKSISSPSKFSLTRRDKSDPKDD